MFIWQDKMGLGYWPSWTTTKLYWTGLVWSPNIDLAITFPAGNPTIEIIDYIIDHQITDSVIVQGCTGRLLPNWD